MIKDKHKIKIPNELVLRHKEVSQLNPSRKLPKLQPLTLSQMIAEISLLHNDNGGVTYNITTGERPKDGYAVGIFGFETRYPNEYITFDHIAKYLKENIYNILIGGYSIGTWYDETSKYTYFDVVAVVGDLKEAIELGRYNAQSSVYDLSAKREVKII